MAGTYEPIATTTLTSDTGTVTFSNISSSYTDLVVICNAASTSSGTQDTRLVIRFNSDTGSNYSCALMQGDGAGNIFNTRNVNRGQIDPVTPLSYSPQFMTLIANVMNYSNTTTYKSVLVRGGNQNSNAGYGAPPLGAEVALWRSTSAINRIDILCVVTGQFVAGSTFTLYGIASA